MKEAISSGLLKLGASLTQNEIYVHEGNHVVEIQCAQRHPWPSQLGEGHRAAQRCKLLSKNPAHVTGSALTILVLVAQSISFSSWSVVFLLSTSFPNMHWVSAADSETNHVEHPRWCIMKIRSCFCFSRYGGEFKCSEDLMSFIQIH